MIVSVMPSMQIREILLNWLFLSLKQNISCVPSNEPSNGDGSSEDKTIYVKTVA